MKFPPATDIRILRKTLDITQTELSEATGVSQSTIAKIERGKTSASYETVVLLFEALERLRSEKKIDATAADVCSRDIISVQSTDRVHHASELMKQKGYSQLPVFNGAMPVGCITEKMIFDQLSRGITMRELSNTPVSKIMGEPYPTVSDTTPIATVTTLMGECDAVLVSEKGGIVGLITKADMLKLL